MLFFWEGGGGGWGISLKSLKITWKVLASAASAGPSRKSSHSGRGREGCKVLNFRVTCLGFGGLAGGFRGFRVGRGWDLGRGSS